MGIRARRNVSATVHLPLQQHPPHVPRPVLSTSSLRSGFLTRLLGLAFGTRLCETSSVHFCVLTCTCLLFIRTLSRGNRACYGLVCFETTSDTSIQRMRRAGKRAGVLRLPRIAASGSSSTFSTSCYCGTCVAEGERSQQPLPPWPVPMPLPRAI